MAKIEWYEGSQTEETPRRIVLESERLVIDEILERARIFEETTRGYGRRLRVRCGERKFRLTEFYGEWSVSEE